MSAQAQAAAFTLQETGLGGAQSSSAAAILRKINAALSLLCASL